MPSAGFELAIPANERPQAHTLDGAATGIGLPDFILDSNFKKAETSIWHVPSYVLQ